MPVPVRSICISCAGFGKRSDHPSGISRICRYGSTNRNMVQPYFTVLALSDQPSGAAAFHAAGQNKLFFPSTLQTVPFAILPTNPPLVPLPLTWTAHSSSAPPAPADPSVPAANKVPPASMFPTSMPAYWVPLTLPVGNTSVL